MKHDKNFLNHFSPFPLLSRQIEIRLEDFSTAEVIAENIQPTLSHSITRSNNEAKIFQNQGCFLNASQIHFATEMLNTRFLDSLAVQYLTPLKKHF